MRYQAASVVGDPARHPSEDAWAADPERGAFAVCDGVTSTHLADGSYPPWAGGARAAWLAAGALASPRPGPPREALGEALARADRLIAALNAQRDDGPLDYYEHDAYNSTAVAALIAPDGGGTVAAVGDAVALLQPGDGAARLLTPFGTDAAERIRDQVLRARGVAPRDQALFFRTVLRNRAEPWEGQAEVGFGVLDGTGRFAPLVAWAELRLGPGDRLYLCSDATGRALAALAERGARLPESAAACLEWARAWERESGAAYPDDLTALVVWRDGRGGIAG